MVHRNGVLGDELGEVVFVGDVCAVPGHDVEGCVGLRGRVVLADLLRHNSPGAGGGGIDVGSRVQEVASVGEAVTPQGSELGEFPAGAPCLEDEAAAAEGGMRRDEVDLEAQAFLDDADLGGLQVEVAELGGDVEVALLRDDQEVAVCVDHGFVVHGGVDGERVVCEPLYAGWVPAPAQRVQPHCEINLPVLFHLGDLERGPRDLTRNRTQLGVDREEVGRQGGIVLRFGVRVVHSGWAAAVQEVALGVGTGGGEGGAGDLLGVEAVGAALRGVLADG